MVRRWSGIGASRQKEQDPLRESWPTLSLPSLRPGTADAGSPIDTGVFNDYVPGSPDYSFTTE